MYEYTGFFFKKYIYIYILIFFFVDVEDGGEDEGFVQGLQHPL